MVSSQRVIQQMNAGIAPSRAAASLACRRWLISATAPSSAAGAASLAATTTPFASKLFPSRKGCERTVRPSGLRKSTTLSASARGRNDIVVAQGRRIADDIDAVALRFDDGVVDRRAWTGAQDERETIAAVVHAIALQHRVGRGLEHDCRRLVRPSISLFSMTAPREFSATMPIAAPPLMRLSRTTAPVPINCIAASRASRISLRSRATDTFAARMPMRSLVKRFSRMLMGSPRESERRARPRYRHRGAR